MRGRVRAAATLKTISRDAHLPLPPRLSQAGAKLTAAEGCTCTKDGQATQYPCPGMNAGEEGVVTCTLPLQNLAVGETADCTVSVLDQRDWGGCVDVQMVSAQAVLPPSPPPAPIVPNTGVYKMDKNTVIDTSADTFTCCALEAELNVPDYPVGAASYTATLSGKANGCSTPPAPHLSPPRHTPQPNAQLPMACTDPVPSPPLPSPPRTGRLCPFVVTPRCRTSKEIVNPVYSNDMVIDMQVPMNIGPSGSNMHTNRTRQFTRNQLIFYIAALWPALCLVRLHCTLGFRAGGGKYTGEVIMGTPPQRFEFAAENGVPSSPPTLPDHLTPHDCRCQRTC